MTKAKSRLRLPTPSPSVTPSAKSLTKTKSHQQYLMLLVLGIISWVGLGITLLTISPQTIQHVLIPHVYLPVVLLFGLGCFFSLAFILLHTRRALVLSLTLTTLFFFRLQQFSFTWQLVGPVLIFFGILELSLTVIQYSRTKHHAKAPHHADIKPQTEQPKGN